MWLKYAESNEVRNSSALVGREGNRGKGWRRAGAAAATAGAATQTRLNVVLINRLLNWPVWQAREAVGVGSSRYLDDRDGNDIFVTATTIIARSEQVRSNVGCRRAV